MEVQVMKLKKHLAPKQVEALKGTFLSTKNFDRLINFDCDGYDLEGNLLFKFRKNVIPFDLLQTGYAAFKDAIKLNDQRGMASGSSHKRKNKDGTTGNMTVGNKVLSNIVGYMDANAMFPYCRKTAFARSFFDKFSTGIPFVQYVDKLYSELCPTHYAKQAAIARGTNRNYIIGGTTFTTVTVNKNFQTAVHKDTGDYGKGFGNLCVYREGSYDGSYFCLPEYRVAVDMQNCDMLFVDVHKWHGNTPFENMSTDFMRVAFVMYYREYMYKCSQPSKELEKMQQNKNGFYTL